MSKSQKERSSGRRTAGELPLIPERFQHLAAIALLFLSLVVFFNQVIFSGKTYSDVDIIASRSFDTLINDAKQEGIFPLWNPYIFCGMPAYASLTLGGDRAFDIAGQVLAKAETVFSYVILNPQEGWVLFFYFVFASGIYLFTYQKVKSKFASFIAAFAATFSMYIIIWVMVGHNTKISVIAFFPYIFYVIERLRERFRWILGLSLVLLLHFSYMPSHVQMIFYMYLSLGIYLLFFLFKSLLTKKGQQEPVENGSGWRGVVRAGIVLVFATALAFAMDADKYLSVLEYGPYSMRGSNPIVAESQGVKTVEGGLGYNYATDWSFAPGEMLTWIVPSWYGFGRTSYKGVLTNNQEAMPNFYSGPQPFTHAPQYMGVVVLALALFGFVKNRKDPFVQYSGILIIFTLFIAFGRELPFLYDLMYRYFPMFNKFRIPSMILVLIQIFVPILAAYGIASFVRERETARGAQLQKSKKSILIAGGVSVGILALMALTVDSFISRQAVQNAIASFANYGLPRDRIVEQFLAQVPPMATKEITAQLSSMITSDILVAIGLLAATFGAVYYFIQGKMKLPTFAVVITLAIVFDLWRVDSKPEEPLDRSVQKQSFATPDYVKYPATRFDAFPHTRIQG